MKGDGMMQKPGGDSNGNNPPQMPGGDSNGNNTPQMPGGGNRKNQSQPFGGSENNSVIRVHVNGHILSFDCDPYIENDSTLVGFRSVTEALGASVEWDEKTKTLTAEGYSVDSCFDGEEALHFLKMGEFDAAVMDIMMPKLNGIDAVKTMRANGDKTPVIFLTARDSISDRVTGLDAGAQDYLIKPFAFDELLARIRAMTRTAAGGGTGSIMTLCDLSLDTRAKTVKRGGSVIALTAKEYELLEYLMYNKGIILSREKIENHIWNFEYTGGTNVVDVYIRYLRKKIDDPYEKKLIHTIRGFGYLMDERE